MNSIVFYLILAIVLILFGCNLSVCFLIVSLLYAFVNGGNIPAYTGTAYNAINKYSLLAVPLFIAGGLLMQKSGIADRLVGWCERLLRRVKGGLADVVPLASMLFGMLTGSGSATTATMSTLLGNKMEQLGWDKRYVAALVAASAPLGFMIPPNMNAILFGTVCSASIAQLFMCSVIPGILWGLGYIILNGVIYKNYYKPVDGISGAEGSGEMAESQENREKSFLRLTWEAVPAFIMPLIIIGGISSGTFSATEAGAVSGLYALIAGLAIFRQMSVKEAAGCFSRTAVTVGTTMIMIPFVSIFTGIIIKSGAATALSTWMLATFKQKWLLLLVIDLLFIVCGMFFDASVLTLVLPPIILPTVNAIGVSTIQFGCMVFCAIGIGAMTPPMCTNLYTACRICNVDPLKVMKPLMQMLVFVAVPIMLLVTYIPALSTWLPGLIAGGR